MRLALQKNLFNLANISAVNSSRRKIFYNIDPCTGVI